MADASHWKTSLKRLFPHMTLVVIYISYLIAGGLIFHVIESGAAGQEHATNVSNVSDTEGIQEEINALLSNCLDDVGLQDQLQMGMLLGSLVERVEVVESGNEWTISTSVLFCMTTITTTGYGTITPVTAAGKFMVVLYSFIGVPLSFIFVADMGGLMAQSASSITSRIRRRCRRKDQSNRFEPFVNETDSESTRSINLHELSSEEDEDGDGESGGIGGNGGMTPPGNGQVSRRIVISSEQPSYLANFAESPRDTVPISIIVCLLFCYICFGAIIFSISEGWSFLDAFYFTFVTMTTIGYGDLYPVKHIERNTMLPVVIYTLLGLCWVAMCAWLIVGRMWRFIKAIESKMLSSVGIKE